ncbi:C-type lectin domain family 4 member M [Labeo rohita]|uniref:C-type lectin domain family 4 member M n=1 Tax=Labeo rohita TaxID=84645 RepID=UPI0021E21EB8|nr:C-type lectin domain family 4 member M [Labeo rohita]
MDIQVCLERWTCYQSNLYYFSSEWKSWTESRRYCTERGADLIIIMDIQSTFAYFWIGLTDNDEEGRWKWVDGSTLTSGFWSSGEPNGYKGQNCVLSSPLGWIDYSCNLSFQWICKRSTLK